MIDFGTACRYLCAGSLMNRSEKKIRASRTTLIEHESNPMEFEGNSIEHESNLISQAC